jgi:hypothetical protein
MNKNYTFEKIKIDMTTIIIDEKTIDAKKMIEYLKTQRYAKIIDDKTPNDKLQKSMDEAETGKVIREPNVNELLDKLKK